MPPKPSPAPDAITEAKFVHLTLAGRIHAVRSAGLAVKKTGEVKDGGGRVKFTFASFFDVMEALQPELVKAGISVGFHGIEVRFDGDREVVALKMEVSDGQDTREHGFEMMVPEVIKNSQGSSVTNSAQRTANAISYAKRIGLVAFFNIAAGNEDDVERMTPAPGQSNIPGLIPVTSSTRWQDLLDGTWKDVMSPLENGKLEDESEQGEDHMKELWRSYPTHPGMMAYWADWLQAKMENDGGSWKDLREKNTELPEHLHNCTAKRLAMACMMFQPQPEGAK